MCLKRQERLRGPHALSTPVMDASLAIGGICEAQTDLSNEL